MNQSEYGEAFQNINLPDTYNKTGITQWQVWGGTRHRIVDHDSSLCERRLRQEAGSVPIPFVKDDFSWQRGKHGIILGGTFKWETPNGYANLDYNGTAVGLGGNTDTLSTSGPNPLRPADMNNSSQDTSLYDEAFTLALGRFASSGATFNYGASGNLLPQGSGSVFRNRYYETELYVGGHVEADAATYDLLCGVRWQNYTVPYDTHGIESVPTLNFQPVLWCAPDAECGWSVRQHRGAGAFVSYVLGKRQRTNHAPGYFAHLLNHNAMRPGLPLPTIQALTRRPCSVAAWASFYDHTVVNAVLSQVQQYSYLFQSSANHPYGTPGDPVASLMNDPRFTGLGNPPPPPPAPAAISAPYTPFVSGTGSSAVPFGLINGAEHSTLASITP